MRIVVSGASGFLGAPLVRRLRADGHDVVQLVRREPRGLGEARWDPATGELDAGALAGVEAAVNLNGVGVGDRRWTPDYQALIRSSRVDATRTMATALSRLDPVPRVLLNASGIDYYGAGGDEELTEGSGPGSGFLSDVVQDWEAATAPARQAGIRVVCLRAAPVMGPGGGAFAPLLRLFRLGLGGTLGNPRAWWSFITLDDHLGVVRFLLDRDVHGPVNVTAPFPARNADLTRALARAVHRPALLPVPTVALRVAIGGFAGPVTASKRVVPAALLDAGYRFRHPDVETACQWLVRA